jgi:hypothetical protein
MLSKAFRSNWARVVAHVPIHVQKPLEDGWRNPSLLGYHRKRF